jgi:L-rhamnose mutarotase
MDRYLTASELLQIPQQLMPMPVLSDNLRSFFSAGIKAHSKGCYGHFMWLVAPGVLASMQTNGFKLVKLSSFLDDDRLKIWWCPEWTDADRKKIMTEVNRELTRRWWRNCYDFLSYPGQLFGLHWLQVPGFDICSDKAKYIGLVDKDFDLENPDPQQVNRWLEEHQPRYQVYGRYTPD